MTFTSVTHPQQVPSNTELDGKKPPQSPLEEECQLPVDVTPIINWWGRGWGGGGGGGKGG